MSNGSLKLNSAGKRSLTVSGAEALEGAGACTGQCCPTLYELRLCSTGALAGIWFAGSPGNSYSYNGGCYYIDFTDLPSNGTPVVTTAVLCNPCGTCACQFNNYTPSYSLTFGSLTWATCANNVCGGGVGLRVTGSGGINSVCLNNTNGCGNSASVGGFSITVWGNYVCSTAQCAATTTCTVALTYTPGTGKFTVDVEASLSCNGGVNVSLFYGSATATCNSSIIITNSNVIGNTSGDGLCAVASGGTATVTPNSAVC